MVAHLWSKTPGSAPIDENQTYSEVDALYTTFAIQLI